MSMRVPSTWLAVALVVSVSLACFHVMTRGFRVATTDQARKLELATSPRQLPPVLLVDNHHRVADLRDIVSRKPYTVVELIYTQCTTLCLLTTSGEAFLQTELKAAGMDRDVGLLSISFDPSRDTPDALSRYARRVKARPEQWTIATVARTAELDRVLNAFGIVVIPDTEGGFTHNGALFLVDHEGRVFAALEPDAADEALARLGRLLAARHA